MKRLALALVLTAGSSHAGVAAYDQCIGPEFEDRLMANYAQRFPSDRCDSSATCPAAQIESTTRLTRGHCRVAALDECESAKCRMGLEERWRADGAALDATITETLEAIDLTTLPALQSRRLGDRDRWLTPVTCTGDATICAASEAGQRLGDLERIAAEVEALQ